MKRLMRIAVAFGLLLAANGAYAQYADGTEDNTDAGETITNEVTVAYKVNTVDQTAVVDTADFVVDRAVLVTVANTSGSNVTPNQQDAMLTFTVTNDSNDTLDFVLAAANLGGDTFDADTDFVIFVESGATAGYQPAEDTATSISDLPERDGTATGNAGNPNTGIVTVYVLGDIPTTATDGQTANVSLLATAYETDGTTIVTATAVADDPDAVDTVFGDEAGTAAGDTQYDGSHSATGVYTVQSATITVEKSSEVISDPFNGTTDPKAIPGAVIEYCILITNAGGTAATDVVVTDAIPANTTYDPETIQIASDCAGTGAVAQTDADDTDDADYNVTAAGAITTTVSNVAASGGTTATLFRVIVD